MNCCEMRCESKNMQTQKCLQQPSFINQPEAEFLKQATLVDFR